MKRVLVLIALLFVMAGVASAQQAGRPRKVSTRPAEPCNARDFVAADDTGISSLCNPLTLTWGNVDTNSGTGTANQVVKFNSSAGLTDSGRTDTGAVITDKLTETTAGASTTALAGAGAGNVSNGAHSVKVTFTTAGGQTSAGTISNITTVVDKTVNGKIAITGIPLGSSLATGRKVYMNTVSAPTVWKLLSNGTIADNTSTTLTANDSDATLAASTTIPSTNTAVDARLTIGQSAITPAVPLSAFTLGGTVSGGGNQINNVIVGTSTPLAGSFTTLVGANTTLTPTNTTGDGVAIADATTTSGNLVSIAASGTAAASNTKTALNIATSGANGTSTQTTYGAQIANTSTGTSSTNVGLSVSASGGSTNKALLVPSGNVGISNASPQTLLHVGAGTDAPTLSNTIYASLAGATFMEVQDSTNHAAVALGSTGGNGIVGTRTNHPFNVQVNAQNILQIATTGVSTFNFGLVASSTIFASTNLTNAAGTPGSICYNTGTFEITKNNALTCTVSSRLFKQNIFDLPRSTSNAFDRLRPVEFAYRDHPLRTRYGFIAEEAAQADPRFADGYDKNGAPSSLDQNAILAATVAEVQGLKARMGALEKDNARLRRLVRRHR